MKRLFSLLISAAAVTELFFCSMVLAYMPGSGIENTPHDLSAHSTYYSTSTYNPEGETQICIFCHFDTISLNTLGLKSIPLWNHAPSAITAYRPYDHGTAQPGDPEHQLTADVSQGPGASSQLCLGCHDGSVAVNRYGSVTGSVYIRDSYMIARNGVLANQHPVGFLYASVRNVEIAQDAQIGYFSLGDLLRDGRMECVTCHDVHNSKNTGEKFLRISDSHSNLCCACHRKCRK